MLYFLNYYECFVSRKYGENELIVVYGPTASGKTSLAVELAKVHNTELISADSRQIYIGMDIGTNKEIDQQASTNTEKYTDGIKIHLVDIIPPNKTYSIAQYQKDALKKITKLQRDGKVPILVGGTGLYIDAVVKGYSFPKEDVDESRRAKLNDLSVKDLQGKLEELDSGKLEQMNSSDRNNPRRLIRAIERAWLPKSSEKYQNMPLFDVEWHQPDYDKDELMTSIDVRVVEMISSGFIDEVQKLLEEGYTKGDPGLKTMGYREVIQYLEHDITAPEMIGRIQTAHRQYARRQITWFKKYAGA